MLDQFVQMQQEQLECLGIQKQAQEQRRQLEQTRYDSLKFFHDSLRQCATTTALGFQNRTAMQRLLGTLLDSQEQELVVSDLELKAKQGELLTQFGKVKGLRRLQDNRSKRQDRREKKQEQGQLDDWLSGRPRSD